MHFLFFNILLPFNGEKVVCIDMRNHTQNCFSQHFPNL